MLCNFAPTQRKSRRFYCTALVVSTVMTVDRLRHFPSPTVKVGFALNGRKKFLIDFKYLSTVSKCWYGKQPRGHGWELTPLIAFVSSENVLEVRKCGIIVWHAVIGSECTTFNEFSHKRELIHLSVQPRKHGHHWSTS